MNKRYVLITILPFSPILSFLFHPHNVFIMNNSCIINLPRVSPGSPAPNTKTLGTPGQTLQRRHRSACTKATCSPEAHQSEPYFYKDQVEKRETVLGQLMH